MPDGFEVDLTSLVRAAEGVGGVAAAMRSSKVADIGAPGAAYGEGDLAGVMAGFCARWEIGVEHLTNDAREIAGRLALSARAYAQAEHANVGMLAGILRRAGADPAASSW
jgi:hypothetical protein